MYDTLVRSKIRVWKTIRSAPMDMRAVEVMDKDGQPIIAWFGGGGLVTWRDYNTCSPLGFDPKYWRPF